MYQRTKREYLRDLVVEKSKSFRPLTDTERSLGFLGWHERGYLPHCDFPGLVQFVTFRLADSMPASRRGEWEHLLAIEDLRRKRTKLEQYLDRGVGECHLRDPQIAKLCEDALLFFHNQRYALLAWCVMPNHVHVLAQIWQTPLDEMIQTWKRFVATKALRMLRVECQSPNRLDTAANLNEPNRSSALHSFWQREYWDTFTRDEEQEKTAVRYIENNPVKVKLCRATDDWEFSSAKFRDAYRRLIIPGGHV
jgi:type I restriction enzyme R subunit/putative DNA methylase